MASEQDIDRIFKMLAAQEQLIRDLEVRLGDTNNSITDTPPALTGVIDSDHNQETIVITGIFRTLTIPGGTLSSGDTIDIFFNLTTVQTLNGNPRLKIELNGSGTSAIIFDSNISVLGNVRMFLGRCSLGVLDTSLDLTGLTILGVENETENPVSVFADHDLLTDMTVTFDFTTNTESIIFNWATIVLLG